MLTPSFYDRDGPVDGRHLALLFGFLLENAVSLGSSLECTQEGRP